MHFHFCEKRLNEALKNILPQRQLDSSIPNQETSRLPSWFMYPIASSCQGWVPWQREQTNSKDICYTSSSLRGPGHCDHGRIWHRNGKIYSSQPCWALQRWPKQHLFHAINNCIIKSRIALFTVVTWQKLNSKNLYPRFLNILFKFLMHRTRDINFLYSHFSWDLLFPLSKKFPAKKPNPITYYLLLFSVHQNLNCISENSIAKQQNFSQYPLPPSHDKCKLQILSYRNKKHCWYRNERK